MHNFRRMSIGTFIILFKLKRLQSDYIEDITLWREDMNFIFEWQKQYFLENKIHIFKPPCQCSFYYIDKKTSIK